MHKQIDASTQEIARVVHSLTTAAIQNALSTLEKTGLVRRAERGVYALQEDLLHSGAVPDGNGVHGHGEQSSVLSSL